MSDYSFSVDYSSLFTGLNTSSYAKSSGTSTSAAAPSGYSYGVNNAKLTDSQMESILSFKDAASGIKSALSTLMNKKTDGSSVFGSYTASSSNTDALTATYNNNIDKYSSEALLARRDPSYKPSAPESLSVKTVQIAQTQKNTGNSLAVDGMELEANKTYRFEVNDGDKTTEIAFVTEAGDTNETVQKKIAQAINDKNIGVKASVIYDDETQTSRLALESRETGKEETAERAFTITDKSGYDAVSKLGLNNMTQEAKNAQYFVKDADGNVSFKESRTNTVQLTDRTSATLKQETDDYVSIGFSGNTTEGINAVRSLVNGFNALYDAASKGDTVHSARLATQLKTLAETYGNQLSQAGITMNENGYLEINEDKMKEAAENGTLQSIFDPDDKNNSYGFAQRLGNIASTVSENPNQYAVSNAKSSNTGEENPFWNELDKGVGGSYSKLYFNLMKYENMGSLFNSMF